MEADSKPRGIWGHNSNRIKAEAGQQVALRGDCRLQGCEFPSPRPRPGGLAGSPPGPGPGTEIREDTAGHHRSAIATLSPGRGGCCPEGPGPLWSPCRSRPGLATVPKLATLVFWLAEPPDAHTWDRQEFLSLSVKSVLYFLRTPDIYRCPLSPQGRGIASAGTRHHVRVP